MSREEEQVHEFSKFSSFKEVWRDPRRQPYFSKDNNQMFSISRRCINSRKWLQQQIRHMGKNLLKQLSPNKITATYPELLFQKVSYKSMRVIPSHREGTYQMNLQMLFSFVLIKTSGIFKTFIICLIKMWACICYKKCQFNFELAVTVGHFFLL